MPFIWWNSEISKTNLCGSACRNLTSNMRNKRKIVVVWLFQYFEWTPAGGSQWHDGPLRVLRGMRAQAVVFSVRAWWCLLKSLAISRLGTLVCKGAVIFFSCLVFHFVSHVPLLQILFRVRACSHVLLHVLSFELLGLCKRSASCVKRRTIFLSDGNFLKPLCFYFCREWSQFYQVNDVLPELS